MPCTLSSTCCFLLGVRVLGEDPRSAVVQVSTSNTIFKKIATPKVSHATAQFLRHEVHPLKLFPRCRADPQPPLQKAKVYRRAAAVLHCGAGSCGSGLEAPQRLPAVLSLHLSPTAKAPRPVPGTTRDPTGKIAEGRSGRWGIGQADAPRGWRHTKKTPSRWEQQGGLERSLAAAYFPT